MSARILVVDDDPAVVEVLSRFLLRDGYEVRTACNGRRAWEQVQVEQPDLILLDVNMPEMDGITLCKYLKDDENTALIPITILTGQDDYESRRRGIEAGADDFLAKPFEHSLLRARIQSQLRLKRLTDQLERTERVIFMLALAVEEKDPYTEGHLQRMRLYSWQLAEACHLGEQDVKAITYGGLLHDIGKIGVSEVLLRKPGSLTDDEFAQMQQHPVIGARIISQMRFAKDVMPIIRGHHERWDGSGYPDGLHSTNIPIGARIIAIVDAYDAMTTDRPYRRALSEEEAIERLNQGKHTQFDPYIVDIFLDIIRSGRLVQHTERPLRELESF